MPELNVIQLPFAKSRLLVIVQWLSVFALGLLLLLVQLIPPHPYPGMSINLTLGLLALLLAVMLLLMNVSPYGRGVYFLGGAYLLFLAWAAFKAQTSPLPAEGAGWLTMIVQGGWIFLIALLVSRPLAAVLPPEQLTRAEKRALKLGRRTESISRLPAPTLDNLLRVWLIIFVVLGLVEALYGVYQVFVIYDRQYDELARISPQSMSQIERSILFALGEKRARGHFGNPNIYCAQLAFFLPAAFALLAWLRDRRFHWLLAGCIGLTWYVGLLSTSRGGLLCLLLATVWGFFLLGKEGVKRCRWPLLAAGTLALLLIFVARPQQRDLYPYLGPESSSEAAAEQTTEAAEAARQNIWDRLMQSATVRERVFYWRSASGMISERPLTGHGLGAFGLLYQRHKILEAQETQEAHNLVFQLWVEAGLIGLLLFLCWLLLVALAAYRARKSLAKRSGPRLAWGALWGMAAIFLFDNLFEMAFSPLSRQFYFAFCLVAGLLPAIAASVKENAAYDFNPQWLKRPLAVAFLVILALSAGFAWPALVRPALAQRHIALADDYMKDTRRTGLDARTQTDLMNEAYHLLRQAQVLTPRDATICRKLSAVRRNQGRGAEAMAFIKQAIEWSPDDAPLWAERGRLAMMMEDYPAATAAFEQAIELYPLKAGYHGALAGAHAAVQQWPEALAAARQAFEMASNDETRAAQLANLAGIYQAMNELEQAREAMQRAIDVAPRRFKPAYQQLLDELKRPAPR